MEDHSRSGPAGPANANDNASWNEALISAASAVANSKDGDLSALQMLIERAPLTAEQRALAGLFLSSQADDNDITELEDLSVEVDGDTSPIIDDQDDDQNDFSQAELEGLRAVNDTLAAALGACPLCWGSDEDCECNGRGQVGAMQPDSELFDEFVAPAVKRMIETHYTGQRRLKRRKR